MQAYSLKPYYYLYSNGLYRNILEFYIIFMSVQLILSSKQIQLDEKDLGVLNIKATFFGLTQPTAVFYKVRTNMKDLIDVRPSFGVILKNAEDDGIATMNIKYLGDLDQLRKMKLQLSWVWGHFRGAPLQKLLQKKLTHEEFKQYYEVVKQNMGNQKSHLLLFTTKYQNKQNQQSLIIIQQHRKEHDSLPQDQDFQNQKEVSTKVHISEIVQEKTVQKIYIPAEKGEKRGVSGIKLAFLVLISFLLGVFLGDKLEDIRLSFPSKFSIPDRVYSIFHKNNQSKADLGVKQESEQNGQQYEATL